MTRLLDLPEKLAIEISHEADQRGESWEEATVELLDEALRMRRIPGIGFTDGPAGRRATLVGSLDVWEIVAAWLAANRDFELLRQDFPWLTEAQLRSALDYFEAYPEEIRERLEREEGWDLESIRRELVSCG